MLLTKTWHESIPLTYQEIKVFEEVFSGFYKFFLELNEGKLDKTAPFWTSYISFMHLYHDFTRTIKMGDLEVFISCIPKLTNIFFALNHPNYERWLVK